jgi:uncharacterized protein YxjI
MRGRRDKAGAGRRGDDRVHYRMRQRLVSVGEDFWIETDSGERVYKVDGKALRLRKTLVLEDAQGHEVARIREKMLRIKDSMEIEDADGARVALVKKALVSPFRDRWKVQIEGGPDLEVHGNLLDHEYTFSREHEEVATVSKKWFRAADTYGVAIERGQPVVIVLAATVALDAMSHEGR